MKFNDPAHAPREEVEKAIVEWRSYREQRLEAERAARRVKDCEDAFKSFILEAFKEQNLEGMLIDGRLTGLTTRSVPTVCDKEKLVEYIKQTGELDLLQFRLAPQAVDERHENGVEVPGTEYIDIYDVFDRKA